MARARSVGFLAVFLLSAAAAFAQQVDPSLFGALRWRLIGPFRAGRVSAGAVDPADPNTYYLGTPGGGVWKSTNAGQTWNPIFDATNVASIGAVAIAPSNPKIIYVGTGEETRGNGVYKSTDGGETWTHIGLEGTHFIGSIVVDATNPDVVIVGAIGDRARTPDRGVFRSTDGGRTWSKALFIDESSGCPAIVGAPDAPRVLYASLYPAAAARGAALVAPLAPNASPSTLPAASQQPPTRAPSIYKSTDAGATWTALAAKGLAGPPTGRQAFAVVAGSEGRSVFAGLRDGLYRSDDGGETWRRSTDDPRIHPFGVITDPHDANVLYVTQTSMYRSTDGGKTFDAFAGAPSGDDFQLLWIDPRNSRRLLAGVDQGGIVSVDGGATWSSWYNQPTGQFYHVSTDDRFPYHVFAAQQDSGSVAVPNRSDFGEISYRDWYSPGGFEFGYVVADPLDANIVFGGGWYRTVVRFDKRTGQITHVFVPGTKYRSVNNAPMAFSPQDPHTLYLGTQYVMKTTDSGSTWQAISPDLTDVVDRRSPQTAGPRAPQGPSVTTLSPSTVKAGVIWAGTNNAVVQRTENGGAAWVQATPAGVPANGTFEIVEAGRHDVDTAYAAFIVPQDIHPYIYRTHDRGMSWQKIVTGLPDTAFARVVREDPVRKGLLYCGTESGVFVSFDDGDHWQSLQVNLPSSSMRDMVVHGNDLVLVTYGRAIWILDDVTPLRQINAELAQSDVRLLAPSTAIRARWDVYGDTPLPIETPTAPNPPEGAIIDYYLKIAPAGDLTLIIADARGNVVRSYSSVKRPEPTLLANVPSYWFAPPAVLTKNAGHNRFAWNLRYPSPKVLPFGYFGGLLNYVEYTLADHAIPGLTPREQPEGALVVPGQYTIELTAGGRKVKQAVTIKADPRITASEADLVAQADLARRVTDALDASFEGYYRLSELRTAVSDRLKTLGEDAAVKDLATAAKTVEEHAGTIQSGTPTAPGFGLVNRDMARYFNMVESGDSAPAAALRTAVTDTCRALTNALAEWRRLNAQDVPALNAKLTARQLAAVPTVTEVPQGPSCEP